MFKTLQQKKRFINLAFLLSIVGAIVLIFVGIFHDEISFFVTPKQLTEKHHNRFIRLGGVVKLQSVKRENEIVRFYITDFEKETLVVHEGILPSLFKENQGAVVEGRYDGTFFKSTRILAKHDEKYMPKQIQTELKEKDLWYSK